MDQNAAAIYGPSDPFAYCPNVVCSVVGPDVADCTCVAIEDEAGLGPIKKHKLRSRSRYAKLSTLSLYTPACSHAFPNGQYRVGNGSYAFCFGAPCETPVDGTSVCHCSIESGKYDTVVAEERIGPNQVPVGTPTGSSVLPAMLIPGMINWGQLDDGTCVF